VAGTSTGANSRLNLVCLGFDTGTGKGIGLFLLMLFIWIMVSTGSGPLPVRDLRIYLMVLVLLIGGQGEMFRSEMQSRGGQEPGGAGALLSGLGSAGS
jgi:hypothetical protein